MRILDKKKIKYKTYCYADTEAISGVEVASVLNQNPNQVFKTLVTIGKTRTNYVFVIPVNKELDLKLAAVVTKEKSIFVIPVEKELDLKKAAKSVGEKSVEMIKSKDLLPTTGYIHGGCSPIGMKKSFVTTIDKSAEDFETIIFSGGKIGYQVEMSLEELSKVIRYQLSELV